MLLLLLCLAPYISSAQLYMSEAEVQEFYKVIKVTREYKAVKAAVDSVNASEDGLPEKFDVKITLRSAFDENIFYGNLYRWLGLGMVIEAYSFKYDRRDKRILEIRQGMNVKFE